VVVFGPGWDADQTGITYKIYPPPTFIIADEHNVAMLLSDDGSFFVGSNLGTGWCPDKVDTSSLHKVKMLAACDDIDSMMIETDCSGYSNVDSLQIKHDLGTLAAGEISQAVQINLDESSATGGHIDVLEITTTDTCSSCDKHAIHVGTGFDTALLVSGADAEDPDYGWETISGAVVDRVHSVGVGGNDAFVNDAVNVELFTNNGDDILIGSDNMFEVVQVILAVTASKDVGAVFYYSKAGGNWTLLTGVDDSTAGLSKNGLVSWNAPADWTKDDEDFDGNAITDAYYVLATRTTGGTIPTLPTESYFKIYAEKSGDTGMEITGQGVVKLPYLTAAPASTENGMLWMESDGLHLYYNDLEKTVAGT